MTDGRLNLSDNRLTVGPRPETVRPMNIRVVAGFFAVALAAGCGGSAGRASTAAPSSPSPSATPDLKAAASAYLAAVGPANTATTTFQQQMAAIPADATGPDAAKIAAPLITALKNTDEKLLRIDWPTDRIRADVQAVVTTDRVVEGDLSNVASQNAFSVQAWENQLASDAAKFSATVSIVRADLGLPATK